MTEWAAGWYEDPEHPGTERYWDGHQYTASRVRGAEPASQWLPPSVSAMPPPLPPTPPGGAWGAPPPAAPRPPEPPPAGTSASGSRRWLIVAGMGLVVALAGGGVAWFTLSGNEMDDHAAAYWEQDPDGAAENCTWMRAAASSPDDFVRQMEAGEDGRVGMVDAAREAAGQELPSEASGWGWSELSDYLRASYRACEAHPEEVRAAAGRSAREPMISACETERSTIITVFAAAYTANQVNPPDQQETWEDYLDDSYDFEYFERPTTAGADRTKLMEVSADECEPLTAEDLDF